MNQPKLEFCNNIKTFKQNYTLNQVTESETPKNFCFSTREKAYSRRGLSSGCLFSFPKYYKDKNTIEEKDFRERIKDKKIYTPRKNKLGVNKKI